MATKIDIISGFLGAGKTTLLLRSRERDMLLRPLELTLVMCRILLTVPKPVI